ncbi:MAG: ComF family protein [Thiohalospira sp.]
MVDEHRPEPPPRDRPLGPRCRLCRGPADGALCPGCRDDLPRPASPEAPGHPAVTAVVAACRYAWPVDRLVHAMKFHGDLVAARGLGEVLAAAVAEREAEALVPVPLHRRRLAERGFNQALEIARPVAAATGAALWTRCAVRRRATAAQSGLDARQRRTNIRGAFGVRGDPSGVPIAIIDDVVTTGGTTAELARALRAAGAAAVEVWAVARADPPADDGP